MSEEQSNSDWIKLSNIPTNTCPPLLYENNHVIFPIKHRFETKISSIADYDPVTDKCVEIWTLPEPILCWSKAFAVDVKKKAIYVPSLTCMHTFQLDNKIMKQNQISTEYDPFTTLDTRSILIADKLHIFQFDEDIDIMHGIYDIKCGEYSEQVIENTEDPGDEHDFNGHSMVHMQSQDKLIFFGGYLEDNIISYDINNDTHDVIQKFKSFDISNYCRRPGAVLTKDEKYVIIFFLYHVGVGIGENVIVIIDIENNVNWTSEIKFPTFVETPSRSTQLHVFIIDEPNESEIIVNGYVRDCWKINQLPIDIIGVIIQFFHSEYLHLVTDFNGEHWKIRLNYILQANKP